MHDTSTWNILLPKGPIVRISSTLHFVVLQSSQRHASVRWTLHIHDSASSVVWSCHPCSSSPAPPKPPFCPPPPNIWGFPIQLILDGGVFPSADFGEHTGNPNRSLRRCFVILRGSGGQVLHLAKCPAEGMYQPRQRGLQWGGKHGSIWQNCVFNPV